MTREITVLAMTAASIGFFHTLLGPDHYLPFIMIAKARNWSLRKLVTITFLCGVGHVGGSIILGAAGIAFGIALNKLELFESVRGDLAAWAFISFGFLYMIWGIKKARRNKPHSHKHIHLNGSEHVHEHTHTVDHSHIHENKQNITPWVLFIIFVLGPCEPLIPLLMYPAARESISGIVIVAAVFAFTTITTMITVVIIAGYGYRIVPLQKLERMSHALAGFIIMLSGLGIKFMGL
ncbi:sulfite exporter TauE/SafE family protein [Candidatus Cloacimonadota bacterium]